MFRECSAKLVDQDKNTLYYGHIHNGGFHTVSVSVKFLFLFSLHILLHLIVLHLRCLSPQSITAVSPLCFNSRIMDNRKHTHTHKQSLSDSQGQGSSKLKRYSPN